MNCPDEKFNNFLERVNCTIKLRKITVGIALLLALFLLLLKMVSYPERIIEIAIVILFWFLSVFVFEFLANKEKTISSLTNLYFIYEIIELFLISLIVYNSGGIEFTGGIFFLFIVIYGNIVLPKKEGFALSTIVVAFYLFLVISEYFGLISFKEFFPMENNLYRNSVYLIIVIFSSIFTFYVVGFIISSLTELLKKKNLKLEEENDILMIKVKARTKELEELANNQKNIIKEKTRELKDKVKELEKFNKLAVGRELRMVELKKENENLKKQINMMSKNQSE